jgi:large subunit ribosomal protein L9
MEVILLQEVENLGYKDELVRVKNGYANNYLIPRRLAIVATSSEKRSLEDRKRQQQGKIEKMMEELKAMAKKIAGSSVKVGAKTGTSGKIFGSVTTLQVADAIKAASGADVDRKKVKIMEEEIKTLGTYKARVELHRDVIVDLEFEVVGE